MQLLQAAGELNQSEPLPPATYQLQEMGVRHREAAALLAQGLDRATIAQVTGYKPEYITWLGRQPIFRAYITEMSMYVDVRLEALFDQSVDVISDQLRNGSGEDKLKAARLQLEATKRIGRGSEGASPPASPDRLDQLAGRLVELLHKERVKANERSIEGEVISRQVSETTSVPEQQDAGAVPG